MNNFINKNKKALVIFFIFLSLAIASYIYTPAQKVDNQNQIDTEQAQQESIVPEENIKVFTPTPTSTPPEVELVGEQHIIYIGEKEYKILVLEKSTVYELMNLLKARGDISFQGKPSAGLGFFVDEISGQKNSPNNNEFWIYYINNKVAQVGVSNYILKPNDIINWKYEKPQF